MFRRSVQREAANNGEMDSPTASGDVSMRLRGLLQTVQIPNDPGAAFLHGWQESRARSRNPSVEGRLSFRRVKHGDGLEPLLDLVETGHRESRFGDIPFSREKARRIGERALADDRRHLLIVVEIKGRPVGFLFASAGEFHIGTGVLLTTIHAIYCAPTARASLLGGRAAVGLFQAVERWSRAIGAREVILHATSGIAIESFDKISKRLLFDVVGRGYAKPL